jgi:hypothetical protein
MGEEFLLSLYYKPTSVKKYFYILLSFLCSLNAFGQTNVYHPFPKYYAAWSEEEWGASKYPYFFNYYLSGDTIVNGHTYTKVRKADSAKDVYCASIRNDSNKHVYVCCGLGIGPHDSLLYDFSPTVVGSYTAPSYVCPNGGAQVYKIDSTLVGTTYRRALEVYYLGNSGTLIEGIGGTNGLLEQVSTALSAGFILNCFSQNGTTLYPEPSDTSCTFFKIDTTEGIAVISNPEFQIQIFPNPATDKFTLSALSASKKEKDVRIYSAVGELVYECHVPATVDQYTINTPSLVSGFYFVEISNADGTVVKKLTVVR